MNKLVIGAVIGAAMFILAGCDTTSAIAPYAASTPNVLAFQSALKTKGATVKVGDFTADAGATKPGCRLVGTLDVTSGKSIEQYIKDAMQTELFTAQVYDVNAQVTINGRVDIIKVNTMGTGAWTLGMQVTSNVDPIGYHVQVNREFSTSYIATMACQNATNAFAPSVQDLIGQVVNNPGFAKLTGRS
ncbi:MAG TPA: hypothetical protein VHY32_01595 [Caulobacteraceae bacterium]|jgi:uncharacterized lipoprotein YajG|nr:hypothetical protein [Caulobacteraceae bacterium]